MGMIPLAGFALLVELSASSKFQSSFMAGAFLSKTTEPVALMFPRAKPLLAFFGTSAGLTNNVASNALFAPRTRTGFVAAGLANCVSSLRLEGDAASFTIVESKALVAKFIATPARLRALLAVFAAAHAWARPTFGAVHRELNKGTVAKLVMSVGIYAINGSPYKQVGPIPFVERPQVFQRQAVFDTPPTICRVVPVLGIGAAIVDVLPRTKEPTVASTNSHALRSSDSRLFLDALALDTCVWHGGNQLCLASCAAIMRCARLIMLARRSFCADVRQRPPQNFCQSVLGWNSNRHLLHLRAFCFPSICATPVCVEYSLLIPTMNIVYRKSFILSTLFCKDLKKNGGTMELREVVKKIRAGKSWTQAQMGAALGIAQQDIQGMESAGRNLEKQWSIFLKLLPICRELGIPPDGNGGDGTKVGKPPSVQEVFNDVQTDDPTTRGAHRRGKTHPKKKSAGPIQAGGIKGNRWKVL
jgi:hypothetical protein